MSQRKKGWILAGLTIATCVLGCDESDHEQLNDAEQILALVRLKDTLYLIDYGTGLFQFNNKKESWKWIGDKGLHALAVDKTTLYCTSYSNVYRLIGSENAYNFDQITPQGLTPLGNQGIHVVLASEGDTIYASWDDGQLYRTKDRGETWHRLPSWPGSSTAVYGWPREIRSHLVVRGNTIYVATFDGGVWGTQDEGLEWTAINSGLPENHSVFSLLLSGNTLYAGTDTGVYRLTVGTTSFHPVGLHDQWVNSLVASPKALYAGVWRGGVWRSDNGGASWQHIGLEGKKVSTLAVYYNRLFVGAWRGDGGVFYTDDEGASWHQLNNGLNLPTHQ